MRIFLDANVLFSASNAGSNIEKLVHLLIARSAAVSSDLAIEEARRNIVAKRPQWIAAFEKLISQIEQVPSVSFRLPVKLDEKDVPLLCAAIRGNCGFFITGDKRDFGHLFDTDVQGVRVVSLLKMAEILLTD